MPDYMVKVGDGAETPVRAANQAQARNWAVRNSVQCRVMGPDDYIELGRTGGSLHDVTDEGDAPAPAANEPGTAPIVDVDDSAVEPAPKESGSKSRDKLSAAFSG